MKYGFAHILSNFFKGSLMIKYTTVCPKGHQEEAYYESGSAFDKLKAAKQLVCTRCGSTDIEKGIMAPAIRSSEKVTRIADMDAVQANELPFVGDLREVVDAANEGDVTARQMLSQTVTGTVSSMEDLAEIAKHGTFVIEGVVDQTIDGEETVVEEPKPARAARRPSAKAKSKKAATPAKKALKRGLN
jgi:hypothetical protein